MCFSLQRPDLINRESKFDRVYIIEPLLLYPGLR